MARLDPARPTTKTLGVSRTCQAWLDELKPGVGSAHESALADLRDFLRGTLGRAFGNQLSPGDLDDLTQDSLLRIHEGLSSFEHRSRFTTWAAAIAVNCAYSELRRRRHQHVSLEDAIAQGHASLVHEDAIAHEPDREAALRAAIDTALSPRQREAILALLGGLPLAEIARRLGTTQGAVYKLLHDARRNLKRHLETSGDETRAPQPISEASRE